MARKIFHDRALEQGYHYANIVQSGDTLYFSGFLSWDEAGAIVGKGDWRTQVDNVYADLAAALDRFGASFADVVKETVYCVDIDEMAKAADVRLQHIGGFPPFAATWVEIRRLIDPDALLEVEIVARLAEVVD